ncbi:MAG: hypothetical protein SGJ20_12460 [Planctomycetota bacterium]|nr:hypothetical protein [Planctomycetota bacterium]
MTENGSKALPAGTVRRVRMVKIAAGTLFLLGVAAIIVTLLSVRTLVLDSAEEGRRDWQEWREKAGIDDNMQGHVQRRPQQSAEPPILVLLRDHFPMVLGSCLVFFSAVYGFLVFVLLGSLRTPPMRH